QNFRNEALRVYDSKKKLALSQEQEITLEQKQKIRFDFLKMLYSDFQTKDYVFDCWTLYDELAEKGKIILSDEEKRRRYIFYRTEYFNALKSSKNASSVLEFKRNVEKAENA
ncbi:hypothetical protein RZS08_49750, partial [Arthrospira platensis SPKY1]|nr:hypothetical protein [Arthrospira platensis SPKY1]